MMNEQIVRLTRIDQALIMRSAGHVSRPMELLLFENRQLATTMVTLNPEAAFQLPMRALAWQDEAGKTWLRVTDPDQLGRDGGLNGVSGANEVIALIHQILGAMLDGALARA